MAIGMRMSLALAAAGLVIAGVGSGARACHTIFVGREMSTDGSVLVAHTHEMGGGVRMMNYRKVPRMRHAPGATVTLDGGARIPQVPETAAYLWSEDPGSTISDNYLNEYGVSVTSDRAFLSWAAHPDADPPVEGGISYMLRRIVAERARTAREGVEIAGRLVARYGYTSNQALFLADGNEAWIMGLTHSHRWVARRVPDDAVVVLESAGCHTGPENLADKKNFMGSPDLVEYAVCQGWYDPAVEPFRYSKVYGGNTDPKVDGRQYAMSLVLGRRVTPGPDGWFPFAIRPPRKLSPADLMAVVRSHQFYTCNEIRLEACVYQHRANLPAGIGAVCWRAAAEPCTAVFVPWYVGVNSVPAEHAQPGRLGQVLSLDHHLRTAPAQEPSPAWKTAWTLQEMVNANRAVEHPRVRAVLDPIEAALLANQPALEATAWQIYTQQGEAEAMKYLTDQCARGAAQALRAARQLVGDRPYRPTGPTPNDGHRKAGDPYPEVPARIEDAK